MAPREITYRRKRCIPWLLGFFTLSLRRRVWERFRQKSATAAREFLAMPHQVVPLHGDIHHGNILDGDERGWLAVDPKGVLGERAFAYANLFCHPEAKVAKEAGQLEQRIDIVARTRI